MEQTSRINIIKKEYNDIVVLKTYDKPIFIPDNNGFTGKRGSAKHEDKSVYNSMRRTRETVKDLVLNNQFTHWGTITYDQKKINRYDLDEVQKKTSKHLNNIKSRYNGNLEYLLVFEHHKDGAWHGHMFLKAKPEHMVQAVGQNGKLIKDHNRQVYNWTLWVNKFGFTKFLNIEHLYKPGRENLEQLQKVANYITKYITKDMAITRKNKKKYWCSRGLTKPVKDVQFHYKLDYDLLDLDLNTKFYESEWELVNNLTGEIERTETTQYFEYLPF